MDTDTNNTKSLADRLSELIKDPAFLYDPEVIGSLNGLRHDQGYRADWHKATVLTAARKPLRKVIQFDCLITPKDHELHDAIDAVVVEELRRTDKRVRVQVSSHISREEVFEALEKLITDLKKDDGGGWFCKTLNLDEVFTENDGWVLALPELPTFRKNDDEIPF